MKSKKLITILIVLIVLCIITILSIPKKYYLSDGGSIVYKAVLWKYEKVNTMVHYDGIAYERGERLEILGIKVKDTVKPIMETD